MGEGGNSTRLADHPAFQRVWAAETVSAFGTPITTLAVQVLVFRTLDAGATGVGLANAARWLPYLLFGLVAGVLVDRARRRPLMIATDLGRGVVLLAVPALALADRLSLTLVLVVMAVFGLLSLVNDVAAQSFVPRLVPTDLLGAAHARFGQSDAVAQTSGPALAGGLVTLLSAPWAVVVDAATYLTSGVLVAGVRVDEPPRRTASWRAVRGEAVDGLRFVYAHATLRPLVLDTHAWFVCSAVAGAVVTPYALEQLGLSAFGLGLALAAAGVGGLVGSSSAVALGTRFGAGRVVVASRALTAVAWAMVALSSQGWSGWVLFGAGQLLFGLSLGAEGANEMGYEQAVTPDALLGRVRATVRTFNRSMIVVAAPVGGVLGDTLGLRPTLWLAAGGFAVVAAALGASSFRHVRMPTTAPTDASRPA